MERPLVSVLMAAYNREKYIAAAIESVLRSTYDNFELLIADDCSKDRTVEIARSYAAKDNRLKVHVNEKNLGQFQNRNFIATLAKGKYLKYLDSDDLIYPTGLQVLVEMMEAFPSAGYGLCSLIQDDARVYPFELNPTEAYKYHFYYKSIFHKAPLSSIILAKAFKSIGGFEISAVCGDFGLWLRLSQKFPVVLMPDGVVWYRVHQEQEMQKARDNKVVAFEYFKVLDMYLQDKDCPLDSIQVKQLLQKNKRLQQKVVLKQLLRVKPGNALDLYKLYRADAKTYFTQS
jgi:glycosyltransferase involved in cell wall biosynthesis